MSTQRPIIDHVEEIGMTQDGFYAFDEDREPVASFTDCPTCGDLQAIVDGGYFDDCPGGPPNEWSRDILWTKLACGHIVYD